MNLQKLLKRQVAYAAWQLALFAMMIIGEIVLVVWGWRNEYLADSYYYQYRSVISTAGIFGLILLIPSSIALFVMWIVGIVNAVKIHGITRDSTLLVIFSIITLIFAHIIVAIVTKKKLENSPVELSMAEANDKATKIKRAFVDGVISAEEYEKKMKELNDK